MSKFVSDVRDGSYPSSAETYHMTDQMGDAFALDVTDVVTDVTVTEVPVSPPV